MRILLIFLGLCCCKNTLTAQQIVDTIPFTYSNGLLVFTGTINGTIAHFAFDTGATITVSNSNTNTNNNIAVKKSTKKVSDANAKTGKINNVLIKQITIANLVVKNVKAVSFDMPYLFCNHLVLLGQDVIKQANWKFNFTTKEVYVSKQPFAIADTCITWQIKNLNRPLLQFSINNKSYHNLLVDMGFTGILDVNASTIDVAEAEHQKNIVDTAISVSMGLLGWGKPSRETLVKIPNLLIEGINYSQIEAEVTTNTSNKIGMQFFTNYTNYLVLNNATSSYHLAIKNKPIKALKNKSVVSIIYADGKLIVKGKSLSNTAASKLEIEEEIEAINNRNAASFANECEFLLWFTEIRKATHTITKKNGEIITIVCN